MKDPFFIVGLPRSRTAWLANFLTFGPAFCLHDGLRGCATIGDFATKLARLEVEFPGDADPGLPHVFGSVRDRFPGARYVIVTRKYEDAYESYYHACEDVILEGGIGWNPEEMQASFKRLHGVFEAMRAALANQHVLEVTFDELENGPTLEAIWEFCVPGERLNRARVEMLRAMRVNAIPAKIVADLRRDGLVFPKAAPVLELRREADRCHCGFRGSASPRETLPKP